MIEAALLIGAASEPAVERGLVDAGEGGGGHEIALLCQLWQPRNPRSFRSLARNLVEDVAGVAGV